MTNREVTKETEKLLSTVHDARWVSKCIDSCKTRDQVRTAINMIEQWHTKHSWTAFRTGIRTELLESANNKYLELNK